MHPTHRCSLARFVESNGCTQATDEMPPWFLGDYTVQIGPILAVIYQTSVDTGRVASKWKQASVCSVYNKGGKSDPANYRPISLFINLYIIKGS